MYSTSGIGTNCATCQYEVLSGAMREERIEEEGLDDLTEVKEQSVILERQSGDKDERIQSLSQILFSYQSVAYRRKLEWIIKGVKQKIHSGQRTYSDPFYVGLYVFASCINMG